MHQWLPALENVADEHGWRLVTYLKSACPFVSVDIELNDQANEECAEYNENRLDRLLTDDDIDYILTSQVASRAYTDDDRSDGDKSDMMVDDLVQQWAATGASSSHPRPRRWSQRPRGRRRTAPARCPSCRRCTCRRPVSLRRPGR